MGEEAFDEVAIRCGKYVLYLTGGYGRNEVCIGIGEPTKHGDGWPLIACNLDREARTALRKGLRTLMGGRR